MKNNILNKLYKIVFIISFILLVIAILTFILQIIFPDHPAWQVLNYINLLSIILFLFTVNRVTSLNGLKHEKIILSLIILIFAINIAGLFETVLNQPDLQESNLAPYRLSYLFLILSFIALALNQGKIGEWIKNLILKFKDPRAFIVVALIFLILCPFFLFFKYEPLAERSANLAYLFLVIGVLFQFILYLRQPRSKNLEP